MPLFRGKLLIKNNGKCKLGNQLTFNSVFKSNPMGINKRCTVFIGKNGQLTIGDNCGFSGVSIYCDSKIHIGNYLFCGGNVSLWDTDFHPLNYIDRRDGDNSKTQCSPINIGNDVFIGANSIILKGVTIGDKAIIGAGSIVTKSIPENQVWAGNPAKFIRYNHQP